MKRNRKCKIPQTRRVLRFSSCKNRKLKVKLCRGGAREKQSAFFVPFYLSEGNFFNICVLSQCIVYWIHFQNINTFTYQKNITWFPFLLAFKIVESLQCILETVYQKSANIHCHEYVTKKCSKVTQTSILFCLMNNGKN